MVSSLITTQLLKHDIFKNVIQYGKLFTPGNVVNQHVF